MDPRSVEKVMEIFFASDNNDEEEKDEEEIAKELKALYTSKPQLLDLKLDDLGRHIFHQLVKFNMPKALKALLQEPAFHQTALQPDHNGQTILHTAANNTDKEFSHNIPNIILEFLPDLLNSQDRLLDTALHLAMRNHLVWLVRLLADKPGLKRSLPNKKDKTPLMLAAESKELRQALFIVDLSQIKSFGMRHTTTESMRSLQGTFPELTARSDFTPTPSSSSGSSSSSYFEEDIPEMEVKKRVRKLNPDELIRMLRSLATTLNESTAHHIFYLCQTFDFPLDLNLSKALEKIGLERATLVKAIDFLSARMEAETTALQEGMKQTAKKLAYTLTLNGISEPPSPLGAYNSNPHLEEIWWLVSCQHAPNTDRTFSYSQVEDKVLGLLTRHSIESVFISLRLLYARFDHHQKLVANYVAAQLLLYAVNGIGLNEISAKHFRFFIQLNTRKPGGLGLLGLDINEDLRKIVAFSFTLRNFRLLKNALQHVFNGKCSFTGLVESALARPRREWTLEVYAIARELKMLSLAFYQDVLLSEFADCHWQPDGKRELAPHITEFLARSEKLRNFFMYTILSQPTDKMKKAFELLIDVIRALCPLNEDDHSDLQHTVFLYTIFVDGIMLRLKTVFDSLAEKDRRTLSELKQLTSEDGNYKFLRTINIVDNKTLPFLMGLLKDVFLAHEETKELSQLQKRGAIGAALSDLMKVKFAVRGQLVKHETDLPQFLQSYVKHREKEFEIFSVGHMPELAAVLHSEPRALRRRTGSTQLPRSRSQSLDTSKSSSEVKTGPKA